MWGYPHKLYQKGYFLRAILLMRTTSDGGFENNNYVYSYY